MTVRLGLLLYNTAFILWAVSHLPATIGCLSVLYTCYKFLRFMFATGRVATIVEQRVLKAEDTLHLMATNHIPHVQMAVEESNKHLAEISANLKLALARRGEDE